MGELNAIAERRKILLDTPHIETASGAIASFDTDMVGKLKQCKIYFDPVQEGSGDPSPDNVRPISGWNGIEVYDTGHNTWDEEWELGMFSTTNGANISSNSQIRAKNYIPIKGGASYVIRLDAKSGSLWCMFFDVNKNVITDWTPSSSSSRVGNVYALKNRVFAAPEKARYMRMYFTAAYGTTYNNDVAVLYPSELTDYEEYQGWTVSSSFPERFYGGYIDLIRGVLVKTWDIIDSYDEEAIPGEWLSSMDVYAAGTVPTTGAQVAYELVIPITYQLDPVTVKTLCGVNNIWSNTGGSVELRYWTHKTYVGST